MDSQSREYLIIGGAVLAGVLLLTAVVLFFSGNTEAAGVLAATAASSAVAAGQATRRQAEVRLDQVRDEAEDGTDDLLANLADAEGEQIAAGDRVEDMSLTDKVALANREGM